MQKIEGFVDERQMTCSRAADERSLNLNHCAFSWGEPRQAWSCPLTAFYNAQSSPPAGQKDALATLMRPGHSGHDDCAEERRHQGRGRLAPAIHCRGKNANGLDTPFVERIRDSA